MKFEWDFSEFVRFGNNLKNTYDFESAIMSAAREIAKVLHHYLLQTTPVKTGNLRKMWSAGDNLLFTVVPTGDYYEVTLINTARANTADGFMYGIAVNDGHRIAGSDGWVMGRFFVEKSLELTNQQVEQIVMEELRRWWVMV